MSRYIRFFITPTEELKTIEDKLYDDPTAIMDAEEIWQELFEYVTLNTCLKIEFEVVSDSADEDEATRIIKIICMEIDGDACFLTSDEDQGIDAELMSTIVYDELSCFYSPEEIRNFSTYDTTNETLKRFGLL